MTILLIIVVALLALIVTLMPAPRHRGLVVEDDEKHAPVAQKFVGNALLIVVGTPGLFFVTFGILKTTLATEEAIRAQGPRWILIGIALIAACIYARNRVLRR